MTTYNDLGKLEGVLIKPDAKILLRPFAHKHISGRYLLLSREHPGWMVLDPKAAQALYFLQGKTWQELSKMPEQQSSVLQRLAVGLYDEGLAEIGGRSRFTKAPPPSVVASSLLLKLTSNCNYSCRYCYSSAAGLSTKTLRLETLKPLLDYLSSVGDRYCITFHGGEPLLAFDEMKRIVNYCTELTERFGTCFRYCMQTNGSLLDNNVLDFLDQYSFDYGVSCDGIGATNDDNRRTPLGSAFAVFTNLVRKYGKRFTNKAGVLTVLHANNLSHMCDFAKYLQTEGFKTWSTCVVYGEGQAKNCQYLIPEPEQLVDTYLQLIDLIQDGKLSSLAYCWVLYHLDHIFDINKRHICYKSPCGAGSQFLAIFPDGRIQACDCIRHEALVLGETTTATLATLETHPNRQKILKRRDMLLRPEQCGECEWINLCDTTCMARALLRHGSLWVKEALDCAVNRLIMPKFFDDLVKPRSSLKEYYFLHRPEAKLDQ